MSDVPRETCLSCLRSVEVLPDGLLTYHYPMPGCGLPCQPQRKEEKR